MSLRLTKFILPPATQFSLQVVLCLLLCVVPALTQKKQPERDNAPKYDLQTETKAKGVVEEVDVLNWGTRKDFTAVTIKSGEDDVHIYLCPKPFEEEIGISFNKGDAIAVTGSKIKQGASDVILAKQLVKGTDTIQFRDDKGKPVWDERTGK